MKGEDTHSAFDVLLASPEIVFKKDIEDATEAKGRFYDVWGKLTNCRGKDGQ